MQDHREDREHSQARICHNPDRDKGCLSRGRDHKQVRQHLLRIYQIPVLRKKYTEGRSDVLI